MCLCAGLSPGVFPMHVCTIITCVCAHLVTAPLTVGPAHWWGRGTEPPRVHSKQERHMMCMQFCAVVLLTQLLCLLHVLHADLHDSVRMYVCMLFTGVYTHVSIQHIIQGIGISISIIYTRYAHNTLYKLSSYSTVTFTSI